MAYSSGLPYIGGEGHIHLTRDQVIAIRDLRPAFTKACKAVYDVWGSYELSNIENRVIGLTSLADGEPILTGSKYSELRTHYFHGCTTVDKVLDEILSDLEEVVFRLDAVRDQMKDIALLVECIR